MNKVIKTKILIVRLYQLYVILIPSMIFAHQNHENVK